MARAERIIISHRGNLDGPKSCEENHPDSIRRALAHGFDCEVDLHWHQGALWLGHDLPQWPAPIQDMTDQRLWCHAKDPVALSYLLAIKANCFAHNEDDCALTSNKFIWLFATQQLPRRRAILVLPERATFRLGLAARDVAQYAGVCTDFPHRYQQKLNAPHSDNPV